MGYWRTQNLNKKDKIMSMNKVFLLGRIGSDVDLKYTSNGNAVANLSIATSEKFTNKTSGEIQEKTEWHKVIIWGKQAENANQFLSKGSQVFVEGKIETRKWEDKDGNNRYTTEIKADRVQFIGSNAQKNDALASVPNDANIKSDVSFASDSIPF